MKVMWLGKGLQKLPACMKCATLWCVYTMTSITDVDHDGACFTAAINEDAFLRSFFTTVILSPASQFSTYASTFPVCLAAAWLCPCVGVLCIHGFSACICFVRFCVLLYPPPLLVYKLLSLLLLCSVVWIATPFADPIQYWLYCRDRLYIFFYYRYETNVWIPVYFKMWFFFSITMSLLLVYDRSSHT